MNDTEFGFEVNKTGEPRNKFLDPLTVPELGSSIDLELKADCFGNWESDRHFDVSVRCDKLKPEDFGWCNDTEYSVDSPSVSENATTDEPVIGFESLKSRDAGCSVDSEQLADRASKIERIK